MLIELSMVLFSYVIDVETDAIARFARPASPKLLRLVAGLIHAMVKQVGAIKMPARSR
jgi:hypothetical protein